MKQADAHCVLVSALNKKHEQAIDLTRQESEKAIERAKIAVADKKDEQIVDLVKQVNALNAGRVEGDDRYEKEMRRMDKDIKELENQLRDAHIKYHEVRETEVLARQKLVRAELMFTENTTLKAQVAELKREVLDTAQIIQDTKVIMHRDLKNMAERSRIIALKRVNEIRALKMEIQEKDAKLTALEAIMQENDDKIASFNSQTQEKHDKIMALELQILELGARKDLAVAWNRDEAPTANIDHVEKVETDKETEALQQQIRIQADHIEKLTSNATAFEKKTKRLQQTIYDQAAQISMQKGILLQVNTYAHEHKQDLEKKNKRNNELLFEQNQQIDRLTSERDAARQDLTALQRNIDARENSIEVGEQEFSEQDKFIIAQLTRQRDIFRNRTQCLADSLDEEKKKCQELTRKLALVRQAEQFKVDPLKENWRRLIERVNKPEDGEAENERLIDVD